MHSRKNSHRCHMLQPIKSEFRHNKHVCGSMALGVYDYHLVLLLRETELGQESYTIDDENSVTASQLLWFDRRHSSPRERVQLTQVGMSFASLHVLSRCLAMAKLSAFTKEMSFVHSVKRCCIDCKPNSMRGIMRMHLEFFMHDDNETVCLAQPASLHDNWAGESAQ